VIQIRKAEPAEHEMLTAVAHAAKRYWGYPDAWLELWESELTLTPESIDEGDTYCAVVDNKVVGVYAIRVRGEASELEHFWVLPGFMGKGVGRRLFEHAAETARSKGADHMRIESDPNAVDFYRKMGAHQVGEIPGRPEGRVLPLLVIHLSGDFA
jgi:GNAT superfamily N-acetyltransferase